MRLPDPRPSAELLFVYGTLMRGFPLHTHLRGHAEYVGEASVAARLVDLGSYPGATPDPSRRVAGEAYRVTDPGLLATLDSVEGRQYHREQTGIRLADGREVSAFIYWYVGPLDRGVVVPDGDYRAHASVPHPARRPPCRSSPQR